MKQTIEIEVPDGKKAVWKDNNIVFEDIKHQLPIIQAFADGKTIEYMGINGQWVETDQPTWGGHKLRIKPEPKYRPFKTQEECWEEMHKHSDFGWVTDGYYKSTISVKSDFIVVTISSLEYDFGKAYIHFTFADGTPFGIRKD